MKKLIAIVISLIFMFEGTGYCLRVPMISSNNGHLQKTYRKVDANLGSEFGRHDLEKYWYWRIMSEKERWRNIETGYSPYIEEKRRSEIKEEIVEPILPRSGKILDIMAGETSVFDSAEGRTAMGIGLIKESMQKNPALSSFKVWNLNINSELPVEGEYDAAVISFGIMYLTNPIGVLNSIWNYLKPGGKFIVVFSKREFESFLAVNVFRYPDVYGYEDRIDVVENYIIRAGGFKNIRHIVRNLDRDFVIISATKLAPAIVSEQVVRQDAIGVSL